MSSNTSIRWADDTWNPQTGCTPCSEGCDNCYARYFADILKRKGNPRYENGFDLTIHDDLVEAPLRWKKQRTILVNNMSDTFHESVPDEIISRLYRTMCSARHLRFLLVTKRAERMANIFMGLVWPDNVWLGVTVESEAHLDRVDYLRATDASTKFLCLEPLLGPLSNLDLEGIDWVIVGGEAGLNARPIRREWVVEIKEKCLEAGIPFFFNQWGGVDRDKTGRYLDGRTWDEMPDKPFM